METIGARLGDGGRTRVMVGGHELAAPDAEAAAEARLDALGGWPWSEQAGAGSTPTVRARELLVGSSFSARAGGEAGAPRVGAWGRFATGSFDAAVEDLALGGEVTTGFLGADVAFGSWLAGLALSVSEGGGPFRLTSGSDSARATGQVESTLTALYPYVRVNAVERLELWALGGLGYGTLTVAAEGAELLSTGLWMLLGAAGASGALVEPGPAGGPALGLRSDFLVVRMSSEAAGGLAAAQADVSRVRLVLAGSRVFKLGNGATLTPALEAGLRHDGGDAESGTGVEIGGRLGYAGGGVAIEAAVRGLVAHEASDYREWGASGSIRVDPGAQGRGLALTLVPSWGAAASGAERLWSAGDARDLAPEEEFAAGGRLEARLGYGMAAFGGAFTVTPEARLAVSETERSYGLGWSLHRAGGGLSVALDGTRRELVNAAAAPEHRVGLTLSVRW